MEIHLELSGSKFFLWGVVLIVNVVKSKRVLRSVLPFLLTVLLLDYNPSFLEVSNSQAYVIVSKFGPNPTVSFSNVRF